MVIRKCALAIAFIFAILLSGCSDEEKEIPKPKYFDLDEVQEFPIKDFKEVDMAETRLNAVIYDITLPKGSSSNTYCMYGKDIYYAVDYPDPMQIGEEFKKENSASIWRYSIDTKKSELIYQCNYEYWVGIDSIKCNGNICTAVNKRTYNFKLLWEKFVKFVYPYFVAVLKMITDNRCKT